MRCHELASARCQAREIDSGARESFCFRDEAKIHTKRNEARRKEGVCWMWYRSLG